MMKITGLSHLFKWENLHNWWLTKYFFAPLYITTVLTICNGLLPNVITLLTCEFSPAFPPLPALAGLLLPL